MNKFGQTICLSMIVKNEAPVIRRCLESVRPIIDHWIIVDTGSTDGTQQIIRDYMKDVPGELHEQKWKDFAFNRSQALKLSRPKADYSLIIDADDFLRYQDNFIMPMLTDDCYWLSISDTSLVYPRIQLVSSKQNWKYRGVLHEFVACDEPHTNGNLPITMVRNHDGARRRDPTTYIRDTEVLEKALLKEKDPFLRTRYTFYLAQSYRDAKKFELAIKHYLDRSKLGGWQEEVFYSLYQVGRLKQMLNYPDQDIIQSYEAATAAMPSRVEARHAASHFCRNKGLYQQGYDIARPGLNLPYPVGCLFGEPWVYETGLMDEYAVNAYWIGDYHECLAACLRLISERKVPAEHHARIVKNAIEASTALRAKDVKGNDAAKSLKANQTPQAYVPTAMAVSGKQGFDLLAALSLHDKIQVMDIGASAINDVPVYKNLVEWGAAHLNAFEGDKRQIAAIKKLYGSHADVFNQYLYDGTKATAYLASPESGMTSLLRPSLPALKFFNGFENFGKILSEEQIQTTRLDDVKKLPAIDFLKMDIQGAELTVLKNGTNKLKQCVAIQLEISFVNLYQDQPGFGDVDVWMRSQGFLPHCMMEVKPWSITPTIYANSINVGGNQLLEGDIVYVRNPLAPDAMDNLQLMKLAIIAHYCFNSTDLCFHVLLELQRRSVVSAELIDNYSRSIAR